MIRKNKMLMFSMFGILSLCFTQKVNSQNSLEQQTMILDPQYIKIYRSSNEGICESGYRPISIKEARKNRKAILDKMKRWDVISLDNGWVINGRGYKGSSERFKRENISDVSGIACYVEKKIPQIEIFDSIFTSYPVLNIDGGSEEKIEWKLFSDVENFIKPVSLLGYTLGFNMLAGNQGLNVGDDMNIWKEDDGIWKIRGNENGECYPNRCDKTTVSVKNIRYELDPESFVATGPLIEDNKIKIGTLSVPLINSLNTPQNLVVDLSYDATTSWSHTTNDSISWKVGFGTSITSTSTWSNTASIEIPGIGGGSSSFSQSLALNWHWDTEVGGTHSWGSTTGGSETKRITVQARPILEPNSSAIAILDLYRADISFPYKASANISYELEFDGKIRNWQVPLLSSYSSESHMRKSFLIGRTSKNNDENLEYLYDHKDIPGVNKIWDWNKMTEMYGIETLKNRMGKALQTKQTTVKGIIHHSDTFAGSISLIERGSLYYKGVSGVASTYNYIENFEDVEFEMRKQLEGMGFNNVSVSIREADKVVVN